MQTPTQVPSPKASSWPGQFLASRWGLICVALCIITAVFVGWRVSSKSEWKRYQEEMLAKGEHLDWKHFTPGPVKDEDNFFAAPGMKEMFQRPPYSLTNFAVTPSSELPWKLPEANSRWKELVGKELFIEASDVTYPVSVLLQWETENREMIDLVFAASQRPKFRLLTDYIPPLEADQKNTYNFRMAVQAMAALAKAHIVSGRSERATPYIEGMYRLMGAHEQGSSLVDAMMYGAFLGIYVDILQFGLEKGAWPDDQLRGFQRQLSQNNCLKSFGIGLRADRAVMLEVVQTMPFSELHPLLKMRTIPMPKLTRWQSILEYMEGAFHGVRFQSAREKNLLNYSRMFESLLVIIDDDAQRIYPQRAAAYSVRLNTIGTNGAAENILLTIGMSDYSRAFEMAAKNQTRVNQGVVVCALELHRRAEGSYPARLDELTTSYLSQIPHDLIDGNLLRYKRADPETFVLYSIGWDEIDNNGSATNDWVWGSVE